MKGITVQILFQLLLLPAAAVSVSLLSFLFSTTISLCSSRNKRDQDKKNSETINSRHN